MHKVFTLMLLSLLSACQLSPDHARPEMPTPLVYSQNADAQNLQNSGISRLDWRTFYTDPRLKALLELAFENNRDMAVAVLRVDEAKAAYGVQRSNRLPSVAAAADGQRSRTSVAAAGGAAGISEFYRLNLSVSAFELDFWGRVSNASTAARNNLFASHEAALAFRLSLMRDVASAYLTELEATARITLAEATVQARTKQEYIAGRRLEAGVTSELEFRQAETLLTQAQAELAALQLLQAQSRHLLDVLVGIPIGETLPTARALGKQVDSRVLSAGLPSELLVSRPDIQAAEYQLIAARANIGVARAAFFPSISLIGSLGYASSDLDTLVGDDGRAWSFGPRIDLPIFDFSRRRANLNVTKAREEIALALYEKAIQTAFKEVADALAGRRLLADQIVAQERGIVAQRRLAELANKRYSEGVVRYLEVLDAERNLFSAEQALLQLRRIQTTNAIALYIALGGGEP